MFAQPTKLTNWLCIALLTSSSSAYALSSDVEKPVMIEADSAVFDKQAGTASYTGNVSIKQGSLEIFASHIEINAPENEIKTIIATGGPVRLQQKMDNGKLVKGKASEINYFVKNKRLILNGNAELMQDKDRFTSNHIEYLPDTGQLKAGGKGKGSSGRVSAVFYPTNKADK